MNGQHQNAVAGPSTIQSVYSMSTDPPSPTTRTLASTSTSNPAFPLLPLYLPPPAPVPPRQHLASTQDLLSRLQLLPSYDKYVRPYVQSLQSDSLSNTNMVVDGENTSNSSGVVQIPTSGPVDKGKGREVPIPGEDVEMHDVHDADEDDAVGKGERKYKNSYKHLIKGIPGKHSTKKDDYLSTIILVPPKQRLKIQRFDDRTQEDAFTVSLEGLKGWNINALVVESAQAREDRKKRKEAKRAAKSQAQAAQHPSGTAVSMPSNGATTTISQPQPLHAPARPSSTPKPGLGTPRPGSTIGSVSAAPGGGGSRPISAVPRHGSATSKPATQSQGQPVTTRTTLMEVDQQRGMKREREESTTVLKGAHANGLPGMNGHMNGGANGISNGLPHQKQIPVALNSKAGTANVRPRPIKKQRMDIQGQARDISGPVQQQPTPQGV